MRAPERERTARDGAAASGVRLVVQLRVREEVQRFGAAARGEVQAGRGEDGRVVGRTRDDVQVVDLGPESLGPLHEVVRRAVVGRGRRIHHDLDPRGHGLQRGNICLDEVYVGDQEVDVGAHVPLRVAAVEQVGAVQGARGVDVRGLGAGDVVDRSEDVDPVVPVVFYADHVLRVVGVDVHGALVHIYGQVLGVLDPLEGGAREERGAARTCDRHLVLLFIRMRPHFNLRQCRGPSASCS